MNYHRIPYEKTRTFCRKVFAGYGFSEEESEQITDVLLAADLSGIESHAILSGGLTSNYVSRKPDRTNICHFFMAMDYGMFGEKEEIEARLSQYLRELRESPKAEGTQRIYTHGEKEYENRMRVMENGISVNDKTYAEMKMIGEYTGTLAYLPELL